ncbi:MAG TPA: hypothetical protein GXX40_05125 [Firmicutes bacterium]|nr:hypothetical protein [Bacillota bacterium]
MRLLKFSLLGTALLTVWLIRSPTALAKDPQYEDIYGHWAQTYITALYEEELTTGYRYDYLAIINDYYRTLSRGYFFPDSCCTKAQFVTLLAKAFRLEPRYPSTPTFRDVHQNYALFGQTPAYGYVEAAAAAGIALGDERQCFRPDSPVTRQEAVALLCRSLGLTSYACSLPEEEVSRLLAHFYDCNAVSACFRRDMAASIKLKIIDGYPDDTLRPHRYLTRAEAATIVYRSCLFRVKPNPEEFSPDGDGFEDTTSIALTHLKNRNVSAWEVWVEDFAGTRLRLLSNGTGAQPPLQLSWDGIGENGPVPDGTYLLKGWVRDANGQQFNCAATPVSVRRHILRAAVTPPVVEPGGKLLLHAATAAHASKVTVRAVLNGESWIKTLSRTDQANWSGELAIPREQPDGALSIEFVADYPKIQKTTTVQVEVFEPLILTGSIEPNPAQAGCEVEISASCSPNVVKSWVALPWNEALELSQVSSREWKVRSRIPIGTERGNYAVTLWAATVHKRARISLDLMVDGSILEGLLITLTG